MSFKGYEVKDGDIVLTFTPGKYGNSSTGKSERIGGTNNGAGGTERIKVPGLGTVLVNCTLFRVLEQAPKAPATPPAKVYSKEELAAEAKARGMKVSERKAK